MLELLFPGEFRNKAGLIEKLIIDHCTYKLSFQYLKSWKLPSSEVVLSTRNWIFCDDFDFTTTDETTKTIFYCLMILNGNGYIREKYVRLLFNTDYPEWSVPFIFRLITGRVYEIVQLIYEKIEDEDLNKFKSVFDLNPQNFVTGYGRMVNYWHIRYMCGNLRFNESAGITCSTRNLVLQKKKIIVKRKPMTV